MSQFIDRRELYEAFETVAQALGAGPLESIASAALRVFRQNCASMATLDVARMVLEMGGKSPEEQWSMLQRAAQRIRGSAVMLS